MSDCNCRERSRFDPDGNLVLLYTCKACLKYALEKLRKELDSRVPMMVQLLLVEEDGQLRFPKTDSLLVHSTHVDESGVYDTMDDD